MPFIRTNTLDYFGNGNGAVGFYTPNASWDSPTVLKNTSGSTINYSTIHDWTTDLLLLHPGPGGQYSIVRFTAPTTATYTVKGLFSALDSRSTRDTITFSGNLTPVFSATSVFSGTTFDFSQVLIAGQTIDFAVGFESGFSNDSTGFKAVITATPEPGFYAVLALGLSGLAFARRRSVKA